MKNEAFAPAKDREISHWECIYCGYRITDTEYKYLICDMPCMGRKWNSYAKEYLRCLGMISNYVCRLEPEDKQND